MRFITGVTKTREDVEKEAAVVPIPSQEGATGVSGGDGSSDVVSGTRRRSNSNSQHLNRGNTENSVITKAESSTRAQRDGAAEDERHDRTISVRSSSADRGGGSGAILPVVEEAGEAGSQSGRSRDESLREREERPPTPAKDYVIGGRRPDTPPKDDPRPSVKGSRELIRENSWKELPPVPAA